MPMVSHAWELDWAHEQLRTCLKLDLVNRDFFHISYFMRQYIQLVNFLKFLVTTKTKQMHIYTNFLKILQVGKKFK